MNYIERNEARAMITRYLELISGMATKRDGYAYSCAAEFLLKHGTWYEPVPYPPRARTGMQKQCFGNSILIGATMDLKYIEGYALAPISKTSFFPCHHAWNLDQDGKLFDTTWRNGGLAYLGVEFSVEHADEATWDGDASILNDWQREFPLLKEPWTGEKPFPASERIQLLRAGRIAECAALLAKEGR